MATKKKSMRPTISYYPRESARSTKTKLYPVCISVRFDGVTTSYNTGVELKTSKQYNDSQKKNPEGEALVHAIQISTAFARMKDIADLIEPYIPDFFAYILKEARKGYDQIFIDAAFQFDARKIARKFLEEYKKTHPGSTIPVLLEEGVVAANPTMMPVPLNSYAAKIPGMLAPLINENCGMVSTDSKIMQTSEKAVLIENTEDGNGTGKTQNVVINQTTVIINGNGGNGQLGLPDSRYNPNGNILTWMTDTMDRENSKGTDATYSCVQDVLIRFFQKNGVLPETAEIEISNNDDTNGNDDMNGEKKKKKKGKRKKRIYREMPHIPFIAITKEVLSQIETFMLTQGKITKAGISGMAPGSVKTYLSHLKSAYMKAVKRGVILSEENPFEEYILQEPDDQDRSLTEEELEATLKYKPVPPKIYKNGKRGRKSKYGNTISFSQEIALLFWLFSFISNGMNMIDILKLTWSQISEHTFSFVRSKTKRKKKHRKIIVDIISTHKYIWGKLGSKDKSPNAFVFDILKLPTPPKPIASMTPDEHSAWLKEEDDIITTQVDSFTAQVNRYMREIAEALGFDPKRFTTYSARHTFTNEALAMLHDYVVSRKLGHANLNTIKKYSNRNLSRGDKEKFETNLVKFVPNAIKRKIKVKPEATNGKVKLAPKTTSSKIKIIPKATNSKSRAASKTSRGKSRISARDTRGKKKV
jgi:integrase